MNMKFMPLAALSFFSLFLTFTVKAQQGRTVKCIDKNWKFQKGRQGDAQSIDYKDNDWESIDVPHDWRIHNQYNKNNRRKSGYLPRGVAWYRKYLNIKPGYKGKRIYISFDGVFRNYTVWVNGKKAGWHLSGYTGCVLDITNLIDFDDKKNVLAVFVDNEDSVKAVKPHPQSEYGPGQEGWWYEGYGIYRHVNLIITNPVHVVTWGTFVFTKNESPESADVYCRTRIINQADKKHQVEIKTTILDSSGNPVNYVNDNYSLEANSQKEVFQKFFVKHPELWSPKYPNLYTVVTKIISDGVLSDSYKTPLGIRWFKFTADSGFYLNGKHLQLRGMNIHAGFGRLGTALPDRANEYDVEIAKKMGVNIIRSAHNDPSPSLMSACDSMGMLLWAETRYLGKDTFALATLHDMIQRDRNHPSIICWGLANNSGRNDPKLTEMLEVMNGLVKKMDPTRPIVFGSEYNGDPNKTGFAFITDVMGYNGGGMGRDDPDHKKYPYRKMLISEYSSGRGARGIYQRERVAKSKLDTLGDGRVFSAGYMYSNYDLCRSHEREWSHITKRPWLAGGIMWSGIEYVGESNGWPVVTSQFGVFDVARFKKDAYYYYLQEWTKKPMVHIFPSWTFDKPDSVINVCVYSNCDEVELYLNGKSLGRKKGVSLSHISWDVPYQSGKLTAKAYDANESVIATTEIKTAKEPRQLIAKADRGTIKADGKDFAFVAIDVLDKKGTLVPYANNEISVKVKGGTLLGFCSGSPMNHNDPSNHKMDAFNEKLLAIIQSENNPGKIEVIVTLRGLKSSPITIETKK